MRRATVLLTVLSLLLGAGATAVAQQGSVGIVDTSTGEWYLRDLAGNTTRFFYGDPGDLPMVGDWDCDGDETPGLYRQSDGFVYLRNSNSQGVADIRFYFGNPGDIPLAGDFDGDGCDTVGIYRPSEGRVYIINELGANEGGLGPADFAYFFGNPGDKPYVGDFDDDTIDEVGLHRESTGLVYFRFTHTEGVADHSFIFGDPGDKIIAAEWARRGTSGPETVGLFRPSNCTIYLRYTNTEGVGDETLGYGVPTGLPVAGDFGQLPGGGKPPPGCAPPRSPIQGVRIVPGQSIQAAVDSHPDGTTFVLTAGTHAIGSPIVPKRNQRFIGEGRPVLTGNGNTEYAFKGEASSGVEVSGLIVERFASQYNGHGTIHAGHGWTIANNEIRNNSGSGIFHEQDTTVTGNYIHHNGWIGVAGFKAHGSVITSNEVSWNGASGWPDRAGSKWVGAEGLTVSNNHFHHNYNNGIWLDTNHVGAVVSNNRVEDNFDKGIHFEASCSGVIRNNVVSNNGVGIFVVASRNTRVEDNSLSGNSQSLRVAHLDRGQQENCYATLNNVDLVDNDVSSGDVILGEYGPVPDPGSIFEPGDDRVTFDRNSYIGTVFHFDGQVSWSVWRALGNDPNGSFAP